MNRELQCPECLEWALEDAWGEIELYCEDCGSHIGAQCPHCDESFDTIYVPLEERYSEEEINES